VARRFRGESTHKVDGKGRVSIPAPFRRVLEEGDPDWKDGLQPQLVIVYGRHSNTKKCLLGFSVEGIAKLEEQIDGLPFGEERERIERQLLTKSTYAAVDHTGRIVLTQKLREMLGIEDEAVFAGVGERFEIWEPAAYEAHEGLEDGEPFDAMRTLAEARRKAGLGP
jgi:MraZ protein